MVANPKITDPYLVAQPVREAQIATTERLAQLEQRLKTLTDTQPKNKKATVKRQSEIRQLTDSVDNHRAYLTLSEGQQVTNGVQLGIITKLALSPGGMPEVWVSGYGHVLIPEQPKRLKSEPFFKHFKVGDTITINSKHPEAAQKSFEIKEFRGDGWILTQTNQLFHHDFIELNSLVSTESEQDLSSSGTAISEHDGEVVEETINEIVEDVQEIGSQIQETVEKNKEISEIVEETSNSTGKTKTPKGISFGKTINQLYQGKTCTRRLWSDRTIKTFINYFEQGVKVPALSKSFRNGGEIIGWLTLTQKPYQDELINMTQADLKAEGFPDYTFDQFINEFFEGKNQTVWVIWFEFSPNQPSQESIDDNDSFATISQKSAPNSESLSATFLQNSASEVNGEIGEIIHLDLEEVRRDGGTQPRTKIDLHHIKRLEEQMEDGQEIEPVVVFFDGTDYWLADGFHRWNAHRNQEEPTIRAIVHQGSRREAILYSVGANADHKPALPRSRADKQRAVLTLLEDPEWKQWSNREIARVCRVSEKTVRNIRNTLTAEVRSDKSSSLTAEVRSDETSQSLTAEVRSDETSQSLTAEVRSDETSQSLTGEIRSDDLRTYRTKHGTITTMNTANIGKTQDEALTDTTIKVTTDEILIAFLSNIEYMSEAQVEAAVKAIAYYKPEMIKRLGLLDG